MKDEGLRLCISGAFFVLLLLLFAPNRFTYYLYTVDTSNWKRFLEGVYSSLLNLKKISINVLTMLLWFFCSQCYSNANLKGKYVIDIKGMRDTLWLFDSNKYVRIYNFNDSTIIINGEWYAESGHHVSFSNWSDKNQLLPGSNGESAKGLYYFNFGVKNLMFDGKIYYDLNNLAYYHRVEQF